MLPLRHSHCVGDEEGPRTWALRKMALSSKFSWDRTWFFLMFIFTKESYKQRAQI